MNYPINDPHFRVEVLSKTERPNLLSYLFLHQCYSEDAVFDELDKISELSEQELGDRVVKLCVKKKHWSVLESPAIAFNVIGFPHSVMVQSRTHRIGINHQVQSGRYTGQRFIQFINSVNKDLTSTPKKDNCISSDFPKQFYINAKIEQLFYLRPEGKYCDREGNKYKYMLSDRQIDLASLYRACCVYKNRVDELGFAPEHARDMLTYNFRQDYCLSFNARSLLHFCDMRLPADAQPEIRTLAMMIFEHFEQWMPEVARYYKDKRYGKNLQAP